MLLQRKNKQAKLKMDAALSKKELQSVSESVIDAAQALLQDTVTSEKLGLFIETCINNKWKSESNKQYTQTQQMKILRKNYSGSTKKAMPLLEKSTSNGRRPKNHFNSTNSVANKKLKRNNTHTQKQKKLKRLHNQHPNSKKQHQQQKQKGKKRRERDNVSVRMSQSSSTKRQRQN